MTMTTGTPAVAVAVRELAPSFRTALSDEPAERADDAQATTSALLSDAVAVRASDVHIDPNSAGARVRFRIDGVMHDVAVLDRDEASRLINQFKALAEIDPVRAYAPDESRFTLAVADRDLDFRIALAPCLSGEKLNIRVLESRRVQQERIDALGLVPEEVEAARRWLESRAGMLVVSGPTGSGKTTTLYALLRELELADRSVVTIEDPSEYQIDNINQIQVDPEHALDFAAAIKIMLRLDPDYLMVGEMRDAESASASLDAALSGRAILTTLHSRDVASTITTLRNLDLADYEIASTLSLVIAQRLVRRLCPRCRTSEEPTSDELRWLSSAGVPEPERVWRPGTCAECHGVGYQGRTGVFETWRLDDDAYDLLLDHADERTLRREVDEKRRASLLEDALDKAEAGETSLDEVRRLGVAVGQASSL